MNHSDAHARSRATVNAHSLGRTFLVALLVAVSPLLAMVAVSVPGVALAFVGGATTGGVLEVRRRRERTFHSLSLTASG